MNARSASVRVIYDNTNITEDVSVRNISFVYTDNAADALDDIELELEDTDLRFMGDWFPKKGAKVQCYIDTENWKKEGENISLYCGSFELDEVECSFNPHKIKLKGVSTPLSSGIKKTKRTRSWEGVTLKEIAAQIAKENGLKFYYHSNLIMAPYRFDQREESDLRFLKRVFDTYAHSVKISEETLIIYYEEDYSPNVPSITYTPANISSANFKAKTDDTYSAVRVRYSNPKNKKTESFEVVAGDNTSGQELNINARAESPADAEMQARAALKNKNKKEITVNISCMGNPALRASFGVVCEGFGYFDGKYFADKVVHSVSGSGYTCSLEGHKL